MNYSELLSVMGRVNDFPDAGSVLPWDLRTMMPRGGTETKGKQEATLAVSMATTLMITCACR